jgi:hypothetical protein
MIAARHFPDGKGSTFTKTRIASGKDRNLGSRLGVAEPRLLLPAAAGRARAAARTSAAAGPDGIRYRRSGDDGRRQNQKRKETLGH